MAAYYGLEDAVTVEHVQAHAGIDIGDVLIGMQLKAVAVPVRVSQKRSEMRTLSARGQDRNTSAASGRITRKIRR